MSKTSAVAAKALTSNHFELFGLAPAFSLDLARLESAYRDIQSQVHPDRYAHAGDAERRASMQMATRVNEAYRTLKNPVRRAKYLLELNGVDVGFETNTAMPKDFLVEQMELRERLEESKNADALERLQENLSKQKKVLESGIKEQIDGQGNFAGASDLVRKLMFLERFGEEIDSAFEALEN
ncbi:MAG TPA: Fe-S protein assembly co-chaperone HscB [Burkholderiales bacterium]|nr:Fe-S protein assembly co-chaperone HscB [Burkholderiales bacterium]